jgi:hypothetical protein
MGARAYGKSASRYVGAMLSFIEGSPEGEQRGTLLCLHGYPESSRMWGRLVYRARVAGWRALAPDLPGYGDSSPDPPHTASSSGASWPRRRPTRRTATARASARLRTATTAATTTARTTRAAIATSRSVPSRRTTRAPASTNTCAPASATGPSTSTWWNNGYVELNYGLWPIHDRDAFEGRQQVAFAAPEQATAKAFKVPHLVELQRRPHIKPLMPLG